MHPGLRIGLCAAGALLGAAIAPNDANFLGALCGIALGLAAGEFIWLRTTLAQLENEVRSLRRSAYERPAPKSVEVTTPRPVTPAAAPQTPAPPRAELQPRADPVPPTVAPEQWRRPEHLVTPLGIAEHPAFKALKEYFTGGNALVRAGVVVLFFGVAFLLRYLAEHSHIPIEFRLSGIALGAIALLAFGWRLRIRRPGYGLALQGGAVGILYLLVFSSLRLYALLAPSTAFVLLAVISGLTATIAVLQNSLAVVLLAVAGGFLAPFLASTGHGNHVALFSYFAVLNTAILGIAWFRSWRMLNIAGFGFTFVLSAVWGVLQYKATDFPTTEPFLIAFFLIYLAIAILYSIRQAPVLHGYIDGTIIFGTPLAAFGLQAAMLQNDRFELACSALAVSALYLTLAWLLHRHRGERQRLLVEAFMALGVAFLTLAIPLALNGRWSAASWALEGAALIWVGCRQNRRLPRAFGAVLQLAAGLSLGAMMGSTTMVPSGTYIAAIMVGIASVYSALMVHAARERLAEYEWALGGALFLWGLVWWCVGGVSELLPHIDKAYSFATTLAFGTVTALLSSELARRFRLQIALLPAFSLLLLMVLFGGRAALSLQHPAAHGGWLAWPGAFAGFYVILRRHQGSLVEGATHAMHAATLWLLAALLSWEFSWQIAQQVGKAGAWYAIPWALIPAGLLLGLPGTVGRVSWLRAYAAAYTGLCSAGLAVFLGVWIIVSSATIAAPSDPLPYVPLVNPLDVAEGFALYALTRFTLRLRSLPGTHRPLVVALALLTFVWLNAVLLRTLHHWAGIPYELAAMMHSTVVQSALSIFWTVIALVTMLIATKIGARLVWLSGAALMAVVVLKLFSVDLSSIGTIERIVSFVVVGLLMLVLGYFSPLPPAAEEAR